MKCIESVVVFVDFFFPPSLNVYDFDTSKTILSVCFMLSALLESTWTVALALPAQNCLIDYLLASSPGARAPVCSCLDFSLPSLPSSQKCLSFSKVLFSSSFLFRRIHRLTSTQQASQPTQSISKAQLSPSYHNTPLSLPHPRPLRVPHPSLRASQHTKRHETDEIPHSG